MRRGLNRTGWLLVAGCLASIAPASALRAGLAGDGDTPPVENTVKLEIHIAGLGREGGKLTIKPAHPGCQFRPVEMTIPKGMGAGAEVVKLKPVAVSARTTAADRDCSFEITLSEPGREPKVYRRGLRLNPPAPDDATPTPARTLKCYLPATAVAAKEGSKTRR